MSLEPARPLIAADRLPGLRTAQAVDELAGTVLAIGLGGRQPQHRQIAGLGFHSSGEVTARQDAMHARQVLSTSTIR